MVLMFTGVDDSENCLNTKIQGRLCPFVLKGKKNYTYSYYAKVLMKKGVLHLVVSEQRYGF